MELSVSEVVLLSVLFAIPQILIFLITYGIYCFVAIKKGIPKLKPLHVVDIAMPVVAACMWAFFQTKSRDSKSFGNLVEISYMGVMWGLLFVYRCWSVIVSRPVRIGLLVGLECAVGTLLTLFMPTLAE